MLNLNYDTKFDILYVNFVKKDSYGEEDIPNVITLRDMNTDEITGYTIMGYKRLLKEGRLLNLPINLNFKKDVIPYIEM